jgi:hypothetical protein
MDLRRVAFIQPPACVTCGEAPSSVCLECSGLCCAMCDLRSAGNHYCSRCWEAER